MRELALHILDLVENCIVAKASNVWLEVHENFSADRLTIIIKDNGRGMSRETVEKVRDPFVTTRTTRRVGLGIPLMEMNAIRAGGYLDIESEVGEGTRLTAVFQHSHLDRPPLGNMVSTVKVLLVINPELEFSYRHTFDDRSFMITTRELREILGEIPLTQPEVLEWLDQYLRDGIANLYGGANF